MIQLSKAQMHFMRGSYQVEDLSCWACFVLKVDH